MGSAPLFFPLTAYSLNIWRYWFLRVILYLARYWISSCFSEFSVDSIGMSIYTFIWLQWLFMLKVRLPTLGSCIHLTTANILRKGLLAFWHSKSPTLLWGSLIHGSRPRVSHFSKDSSLLPMKMVFGDPDLCT